MRSPPATFPPPIRAKSSGGRRCGGGESSSAADLGFGSSPLGSEQVTTDIFLPLLLYVFCTFGDKRPDETSPGVSGW